MAGIAQAVQQVINTASPAAVAYAVASIAHNIGFLFLGWTTTGGLPVVGDGTNTWTLLDPGVITEGSNRSGIWYCADLPAGATVTATLAGATFSGILLEYNNGGHAGGTTQSIGQIGGSSGALPVAGTVLLVTGFYAGAGGGPTTVANTPGVSTTQALFNQLPGGIAWADQFTNVEGIYTGTGTGDSGLGTTFLVAVRIAPVPMRRVGTVLSRRFPFSVLRDF